MQVRTTNNAPSRSRSSKTGTRKKGQTGTGVAVSSTDPGRSPFQQILQEVLPADSVAERDLHKLWQELPDTEKELLEHPSDRNLRRYRELVIKIARATLQQNTRVRKVRRRNSRGETVELSVVEFINARLQKMAETILHPQNSAFHLLKTVEEIRGVLLDVRE